MAIVNLDAIPVTSDIRRAPSGHLIGSVGVGAITRQAISQTAITRAEVTWEEPALREISATMAASPTATMRIEVDTIRADRKYVATLIVPTELKKLVAANSGGSINIAIEVTRDAFGESIQFGDTAAYLQADATAATYQSSQTVVALGEVTGEEILALAGGEGAPALFRGVCWLGAGGAVPYVIGAASLIVSEQVE